VGGAAGVAGQLASAARRDHEGAGFGERGDAAHDDVGAGEQPPDVVGAGDAVGGQDARPDGPVCAASQAGREASAKPRTRAFARHALQNNRCAVGPVRGGERWLMRTVRIDNVWFTGDPQAVPGG
jgi:hypothetical protein